MPSTLASDVGGSQACGIAYTSTWRRFVRLPPAIPDEVTMRLIAVLASALFLVIAPMTILGLWSWRIMLLRFFSLASEAPPLRAVDASPLARCLPLRSG